MAFRHTPTPFVLAACVLVDTVSIAHCAPPGGANAYVTFHVDELCVTSRVENIQRELVSKDSCFEEALQSIPTLRVTINIFNVGTNNETIAKGALRKATANFRRLYDSKDQRQVQVNGIGQFLPRTLLATFTEDRSRQLLQDLYIRQKRRNRKNELLPETVKETFASEGIKPLNQYEPYQPHITIVDLPKNTTCSSEAWQPLVTDGHFSSVQKIKVEHALPSTNTLQLCWMHSPDDGSFCRLISKSKL